MTNIPKMYSTRGTLFNNRTIFSNKLVENDENIFYTKNTPNNGGNVKEDS